MRLLICRHLTKILQNFALRSKSGIKPLWPEVAQEGRILKSLWAHWEQLMLLDERQVRCFCTEYRVVTPRALQPYVVRELHDAKTAGHLCIRKTKFRVCQSRFFWPGTGTAALRWVRNCLKCGSRKRPKHGKRQPLQTYYVGAALDRVSIDIL